MKDVNILNQRAFATYRNSGLIFESIIMFPRIYRVDNQI